MCVINHSFPRLRVVIAVTVALALGAGATAWWWRARPRVADPPPIEQIGEMDPDVASLLRDLRQQVVADRQDATRRGQFGMACEANGFIGVARGSYEAAVVFAPEEPRWWYRLGLVRARLGEDDAAISALARAAELAPQYVPAWSKLGHLRLDRGDMTGADAAFDRAAAIDAGDVSASTGRARVRLQQRDDRGAAKLLEQLLERHPGDRYALQLLGTAYRRLGRVDEARFALAVGTAVEPSSNDPWSDEIARYRRGYANLLKTATGEALAGRFDRAISALEQLRQRNPDDVALVNHLGDVLVAAGRHADAVSVLARTIDRGRANADTHLVLASAYLAAGDMSGADAAADRAIRMNAPLARAYEVRALIAWRSGRRDEALRLMQAGIARDPRNVRLLAWSGLVMLEEGRPHDALTAFGEALRREPLHPEALAGLAMAQASLGARGEALLALARAEQVAPDHPRVREAKEKVGKQ